jgi:hypothetical protein
MIKGKMVIEFETITNQPELFKRLIENSEAQISFLTQELEVVVVEVVNFNEIEWLSPLVSQN